MGFEVYCYIRIHTNNEEEFQQFLRDDSAVFWQFKKNNTFERYKDSYFFMAIYMPIMKEDCIELVEKYHSFLIVADWHEEANPDHGYYMIRWNGKEIEEKSIDFDYTCVEERGEFNSGAKKIREYPIEITYDKKLNLLKPTICKKLSLHQNHMGYYSQVWLDTCEDQQLILDKFPLECIRSYWRYYKKGQMILWTPEPLRNMFGDTFREIICEWWSEDGMKGGVWVKQNAHEGPWQQKNSVNDSFEFDYPRPYTPSYGKMMTPIDLEKYVCFVCRQNNCVDEKHKQTHKQISLFPR